MITSLSILSIFIFYACNKKDEILITEGYAPIYTGQSDMFNIKSLSIEPLVNPGKIYEYGNYTFQIESGKGIHIINHSNLTSPHKIGFIAIQGCSDIAIRNNILLADNFNDLVTLDISNINNVVVTSRQKGIFPVTTLEIPPFANAYFECVDNTKGIVTGWSKKTLTNPLCKTQ
jgi:hypothetical protein